MRKGPKSAAVLAVMVITVFALYYYLVNKVERSSPEVETTAIQDVLLRNLETDYPATVREVIKYYNEIMSCYYSESPTDEELKDLADKALELYDTELVNFQSEEMYLADLKTEIAGFASSGRCFPMWRSLQARQWITLLIMEENARRSDASIRCGRKQA